MSLTARVILQPLLLLQQLNASLKAVNQELDSVDAMAGDIKMVDDVMHRYIAKVGGEGR